MRKENNLIILEKGDCLYRYDILSNGRLNLPDEWSQQEHSIEYCFKEYGHKNQIGAFFFYENEGTAMDVLKQAFKNEQRKQIAIQKLVITSCQVTQEISLFNLVDNVSKCSQIISVLKDELDLDVLSDSFINYPKETSFSEKKHCWEKLYSEDVFEKINAGAEINNFFFDSIPFLGQSLTDFNNGFEFKKRLLEKNYEGYVFKEAETSSTFCLLNANKISAPKKRIIQRENLFK